VDSLHVQETDALIRSVKRPLLRWDKSGFVEERLIAAWEAQRDWATTPVRGRLAHVCRLRHRIAANATRLAEAVQASRHNPLAECLAGEVLPLADACRFLEREAARLLRPRRLGSAGRPSWLTGVRAEVRREPHGIILIIGPFNYPLLLLGVQAVQALVAGNSVLLKPGVGGTLAAEVFVQLCQEAGFDSRLVQVLPEAPEAAIEAIEAGVDKVILTGSAETGEKILQSLAPRLIPATLELSGCDADFVRPDADLNLVARALRFAMLWNRGATCIAPHRIFVPREIAAEFESHLLAVLEEMPKDPGRWKLPSKVDALVRDAISRGARPLSGLGAGPDQEAGPTVLADACVSMPLLREDLFAPLLAIVPVSGEDDALAAAEQCPYALGATVFGEERQAEAFAKRVRAGVVVINDVIVPTADPRLPFGGRGRSGFGVTRGPEGLLEMTAIKVIAVRHDRTRWHLDYPDLLDQDLVQRYIEAVHGTTWVQRLAAWCSLLGKLTRNGLTGVRGKEHTL
jgi:acyl-CoA reductase-like NAD-dependent aldehyde dehydrogenase